MKVYEKVNPSHPDKVADRIAGAMVDAAYAGDENPKIAVEVLIGHGNCTIYAETSVHFELAEIERIVERIAKTPTSTKKIGSADSLKTNKLENSRRKMNIRYLEVPQDQFLAENQSGKIRCGDNGIFLGVPMSEQEQRLSRFAKKLYREFPSDGKYMIKRISAERDDYYVCQSQASAEKLNTVTRKLMRKNDKIAALNPLGEWTGGLDVDSGAINRKLGSDLGQAVTGGGLHGKDLSKADVALTIYAHLEAQKLGHQVEYLCAIGDEEVDGKPYAEIVKIAKDYVDHLGGFEKLAEWGLI